MTCEIAALREELDSREKNDKKHDDNQAILSDLYEKGIIDENGNLCEKE
jgi:hypothetical protein